MTTLNRITQVAIPFLILTTACNTQKTSESNTLAENESNSTILVGSRETVSKSLQAIVGHEICSGKITEESINPETGLIKRQVWERRAKYVNLEDKGNNFTVQYQVNVVSEFSNQKADGSFESVLTRTNDSVLEFKAVWSPVLGRYIGQTHWLAAKVDGVDKDLSAYQDHKITSLSTNDDGISIKYIDIFPRQGSDKPHLNSYEESLSVKTGKLVRNWSYKTFEYDRNTLEPTVELDLGAQPSIDTEEKCSVGAN